MVGDAAHTAQHLQRFAAIGSVKRFREWGVLERQSGVGRRPWLAWEYVEGHTVARLVAEGRVHDPLDLLCRICEALLPVHRAGLSIGDFDRGRNLLIQTKTRLVKFCDLDAGTPLQDAPGQAEDMDEMLRLARAMWRRLGESPSDRVCSALSRLSRADRVLDRLLTLQGFG
jgi:hypothetical protein